MNKKVSQFQPIMINNTVKPSVTFLDGATYQKEFPAWVPHPGKPQETPENNLHEHRNNVYYESLKPIFIVLTMAGILPVSKINKIGKRSNKQKLLFTLLN